MAPPAGTLRVGRYFLALLAILAVLYTIVLWPGSRHTPKLGLDLVGGTEVVFTAKTPDGKTPSRSSMEEARQIMEARVNGTGVTEATVVIQGNNQIVVSIPGGTNTDLERLGQAAELNLRGAVMAPQQVTCTPVPPTTPTTGASSSGATPTPTSTSSAATVKDDSARPLAVPHAAASSTAAKPVTAKATPTTKATPTAAKSTPTATASPSAAATPTKLPDCLATPLATQPPLTFPIPTAETCVSGSPAGCVAYDKLTAAQQQELKTALSLTDCSATSQQSDTAPYYVACDGSGYAYLLGPVIVQGRQISSASAVAPNFTNGQSEWTVSLNFKSSGQASWATYTAKHNLGSTGGSIPSATECSSATTSCAVYVGFVLDGKIISVPANETAINGGSTQISGSFTQSSATQLANQLKYGALPLSFTNQAAQSVSATLGSAQLKAGLLAGGIGLILVVLYSLMYYRALGLVTIASLVVSGVLTYGCLVVLGTQIGFTLSLAGIAGFIVAVGITADSFVVFFERIKDEVHGGRSMRVAIPRAWVRARRTILSADTVSFLAAAILYYFAAGDVRGFAFTLGLSTVLDLVVVFLFTHPLISLLSRSRAFGSARFTGLDALRGQPIPDPVEPAARGARRRPGSAASGAKAEQAASAVAVLEREHGEDAEEDLPLTVALDADDAPEPAQAERPRTAPEAGSAAERAAARRAKLRGESPSADEEGKR